MIVVCKNNTGLREPLSNLNLEFRPWNKPQMITHRGSSAKAVQKGNHMVSKGQQIANACNPCSKSSSLCAVCSHDAGLGLCSYCQLSSPFCLSLFQSLWISCQILRQRLTPRLHLRGRNEEYHDYPEIFILMIEAIATTRWWTFHSSQRKTPDMKEREEEIHRREN